MSAPLITLDNAAVRRGNHLLLRDISLAIRPREIVTVIGPNGAGKSTLVKLASGLIKPSQGRVERRPQLRIGYVPQRLTVDGSVPLTVERFLSLSADKSSSIGEGLARLKITHLRRQPVQQLSGGELQRVLLARAFLRQPHLLVLDEPVQGVDVAGQAELYKLITELRDSLDCAVLMVSHDLHLVMAETDHVVCLNQHICCQGQPENISTHPAYLELFGGAENPQIAVYTHQHDHAHDIHGDVIQPQQKDD